MRTIRKAAVLGAGVMGAQIAALLAGAGIPVYLLDLAPQELTPEEKAQGLTLDSPAVRNRLAAGALRRLQSLKPSPLFHPGDLDRIQPGNFDDHLGWLGDADWVIEAVVERLDAKVALWQQVAPHVRPGTILSSNTSGLSIAAQAQALPSELRRTFLGTHFFNPPRYLRLLEVIPTPETDPAVTAFVRDFAERALGKGVVVARDTPGFIANRIGVYSLMATLHAMGEMGLTVEQVDALTGPLIGRPRSATFRTADVVGLDTLAHVVRNTAAAVDDPEERAVLTLPPWLEEMLRRGWTGEKAGQGFYKRVQGEGGRSEIWVLDLATLEYRPQAPVRWPEVDQARAIADLGARLRHLLAGDGLAARFLWRVLRQVLAFCARKAYEVAGGDLAAVDRALRLGFGWELGPFALWNALGVQAVARRMADEGEALPDWVLACERFSVPDPAAERPLSFAVIKGDRTRVLKAAPGATVVDLGDDVLGLEFHSPKQAIGADYVAMARWAAAECLRNWRGLVIAAEAENFCVGANLALVLMAAQEGDWDEIDRMVREFQQVNRLLRDLPRPVVVATRGMTLGGGLEVAMHSAAAVAAAETYMGLVEAGVGLIPAGGGCKEMAVRWTQRGLLPPSQVPGAVELVAFIGRAFEYIATARVAESAHQARDLGFLRPTDRIVMNVDHLLAAAKDKVLRLDAAGWRPPAPARIPVLGPSGRAVLELAAYHLQRAGQATDHDVHIARKLAHVLTGGDLPGGTVVGEEYLLDLEREAFLSLCGHPKTQQRMAHLLQTGKPLRN